MNIEDKYMSIEEYRKRHEKMCDVFDNANVPPMEQRVLFVNFVNARRLHKNHVKSSKR